MTLENLLQTAKETFRFYVDLAKGDPKEVYYWSGCLRGVLRMAFDSIERFSETVSKDEFAEAYDVLDEAYGQAYKDIHYFYKKAMNNDD